MNSVNFHGDADIRTLVAGVLGDSERPAMPWVRPIDRRTFLRYTGVAGGGLMLAFSVGCSQAGDAAEAEEAIEPGETFTPNGFVQINHDGIRIYAMNPEIGQGVKTSLPMIVAEELDAAWNDVEVVQSDIDPQRYGMQFAGGSRSVPQNWQALRQAGAVARKLLMSAAAIHWQVDMAELRTENSHVIHGPSGRQLSYLALADSAARLPVPDNGAPALKAKADFRLLGKRITGVDNPALVRGEPLFASDQQLPGMKVATYVKGPATGAKVRSANLDAIRSLPGVVDAFVLTGNGNVTELMPGVAIVGNETWAVLSARRQLEVEWDDQDAAKDSWQSARERAHALADEPGERSVADKGDVDAAMTSAEQQVEAFYEYSFVSHAQLEPQTTTVWVHDDGQVEVWSPSQTPGRAIQNVAAQLGVSTSQIKFHQLRAGGGFGRRLVNDSVCEAAAIAAKVDGPVKLQWTREDDMAHDFFRAGGFHALKGGLTGEGKIAGWQNHFITFSADGNSPVSGGALSGNVDPGPFIDNYRLTQTMLPWHTPCGAWRAPGSNVFAFPLQCFLHELSVAAGRDHLEFLLELFGEPRLIDANNPFSLHTGRAAGVVRLAAERAGWGKSLPDGHGMGLAFYFSHAGHFAEVVELSVDNDKRIQVHKVTVAGDVGPIVNLSGAEAQVEGSVIDALSALMAQEVTHEDGRVQQRNFDRYPLLRMAQSPLVDVHFVDSDYPPTGLGEPAVPPLAPAFANALYMASGDWVRVMPLSRAGYRLA